MTNILFVTRDNGELASVEKAAREHDFRVKETSDTRTARKWLEMFEFNLLFVSAKYSLEEQEEMADLLWRKSPSARFVIFDFSLDSARAQQQVRLSGAEVAFGEKAISALIKCIESSDSGISTEKFPIMVIEDLDSPRDIICMYVESLGYSEVRGMASAIEALEELNSHPDKYKCIISDIKMPKMNGCEFIKEVRKSSKLSGLPIICLTAHGTADVLLECLEAGASGFLTKPPKKQDLIRELTKAHHIIAEGSDPRLIEKTGKEALIDALVSKGFAFEKL